MAGESKPDDNTFGYIFLFGCLFGGIYGIWYLFEEQLLMGLGYLRLGQLWIVDTALETVGMRDRSLHTTVGKMMRGSFDYDTVVGRAQPLYAEYYRWPQVGLIFFMSMYVMFFASRSRFRTKHGLESLMAKQALVWKYIIPVLGFDPSKANARSPGAAVPKVLPVFAEALSPEEWIVYNGIHVDPESGPDADAARRVFVRQLLGRWRGAARLPDHGRALFAAFALKGARKRQDADDLLGELSACYDPNKGLRMPPKLRRKIDAIIKDPKIGGPADEAAREHAFVATAMLKVLEWARIRGGVLAPAQFLWLRGEDRDLWYPLNNLGRGTYHAEAAGALAHFRYETKIGRPVVTPKIDAAVEALGAYVQRHNPAMPPRA